MAGSMVVVTCSGKVVDCGNWDGVGTVWDCHRHGTYFLFSVSFGLRLPTYGIIRVLVPSNYNAIYESNYNYNLMKENIFLCWER